ncbi:MAG: ATP-binding protein [Lachnospiraceae bacterium]|nr:ATP-binding protein [Lachnospiraceae bacterium]
MCRENEWRVQAELDEWDDIRKTLWDRMLELGFDPEEMTAFLVGVEEMFVNIVSYAYEGTKNTEKDILVSAEALHDHKKGILIRLTDSGVSFDPSKAQMPTPAQSAAGLKIGGWGIFLAKERSDEFRYERWENKNILELVKYSAS